MLHSMSASLRLLRFEVKQSCWRLAVPHWVIFISSCAWNNYMTYFGYCIFWFISGEIQQNCLVSIHISQASGRNAPIAFFVIENSLTQASFTTRYYCNYCSVETSFISTLSAQFRQDRQRPTSHSACIRAVRISWSLWLVVNQGYLLHTGSGSFTLCKIEFLTHS